MRKLLCIILFGLSLPGWAQTNVVANGGFEDPRNFLQGWDSVYGAGGLLVSPTAAEGRNFAMVTGNLYQDLPTVPGKVYRLRYAVAGDPYWQGPTTLQTFWGGSLVASTIFDTTGHSNESLGWIYVTNNLLATLTTIRLWFGNPGYGVATIPYLDAVSAVETDAQPTACIGAPAGLVSWWTGQSNALDSVSGHDGTPLNGASLMNALVGRGFYLAGSNQCVKIPYAPSLATSNYSIETWVEPLVDMNSGDEAVIFAQSQGQCQLMLRGGSFGPRAVFQFSVNGLTYDLVSSNPIAIGGFTHLAGTWNGTTLGLYIGGALDSEREPEAIPVDSGCPFYLGGFYNLTTGPCQAAGKFFNGIIDEPSYYQRALSDAEIEFIHNAGGLGKCRVPVPPAILVQPTHKTVYAGETVTFSVTGTGDVPLGYQWRLNGTNLFAKITPSITITNLQTSNSGNYSVLLKNPAGTILSSNALLTVLPPPACAPLPNGLISWWRAENDLLDGWGANAGSGQLLLGRLPPNVAFVQGKVGNAFSLLTNYVLVSDVPSLRPTNGLTIEGWIFPRTFLTSNPRTILSKFDPPNFATRTNSGYYLGLTNGLLYFALSSTGSGRTNTSLIAPDRIPTNQWSYVAATYDGASMRLYLNGSLVAQTNYSCNIFPGTSDLGIGAIPYFPNSGSYWPWYGYLDELSLYDRALADGEIEAIYHSDLTGKCSAPPQIVMQPQSKIIPLGEDVRFSPAVVGSKPLRYQWFFQGQSLPGKTSGSLILEKVQSNSIGNYSVLVSNKLGAILSSNALLSLLPPPACSLAPIGMVSWWPGDGSSIDAVGTNFAKPFLVNGTVAGSFPTGKVDRALIISNLFGSFSSSFSVTNSESLNFGTSGGFSIESWVKIYSSVIGSGLTAKVLTNQVIVDKRSVNSAAGLLGPGYGLSIYRGHPACWLSAVSGRVTNSALFVAYGADASDGLFHHVALTVERRSSSGVRLYLDGQLALSANATAFSGTFSNSAALAIGSSLDIPGQVLNGLLDELTIYNRALSPEEIRCIAQAGAAGKCKIPPSISIQPAHQAVLVGGAASFSVTADGTPNLRYQWRFNSTNIPDATRSLLIVTNVQLADAGAYSVQVTNGFGSTASSDATLSIDHPPVVSCANVTVAAGANCVADASVNSGSFDPDGDPMTVVQSPPGPYMLGDTVVTLTATDIWGASNACNALVTVRDVTPPVIVCPAPIIRSTGPDLCGAFVAFPLPQASDLCSAVTNVATIPPSGSFFALGDTIVQATAADAAGNITSCTFTVSVRDMQPPRLSCPADIVVTNAHDAWSSLLVFQPTVSDNCPSAGQIVCQPASGSAFDAGTHVVLCSTADAAGNSSQCTFQVIVYPGNVAPVPVIEVTPHVSFSGHTNLFVIAPNGTNVSVLFDGSKSYDTDDANFDYAWLQDTNLFSTNAAASILLDIGSHEITLVLNDHFPLGTNSASALIQVISPIEAVGLVINLLNNGDGEFNREPLFATLEAALTALEKGHPVPAINQLAAFQGQVRAQIAPAEMALADELTHAAQLVIEALLGRTTR